MKIPVGRALACPTSYEQTKVRSTIPFSEEQMMEPANQKASQQQAPLDRLNATIGVLTRREVEARILAPLIDALCEEFDREKVLEVVRDAIIRLAQEQGAELAEMMGGSSCAQFADSLQYWTKDNALEIDVLEQTAEKFSFNVTRCRYAELYQSLGIPELGALLSCNRDFALIDGFNPDASLTRTQTIMSGASCCDFRYTFKQPIELKDG